MPEAELMRDWLVNNIYWHFFILMFWGAATFFLRKLVRSKRERKQFPARINIFRQDWSYVNLQQERNGDIFQIIKIKRNPLLLPRKKKTEAGSRQRLRSRTKNKRSRQGKKNVNNVKVTALIRNLINRKKLSAKI